MNSYHRLGIAGFSLVEVSLALGIIAFAFVGIFGLVPAGMNVFRESMNASVSAQIAQRVLNEAQQTQYAVLIGGAAPEPIHVLHSIRYFDDEGNELPETNVAAAIYQVRVVTQNSPKFPDNAGQNTVVMDELAVVTVQIAFNPGRQPVKEESGSKLWLPNKSVPIQNFAVLVAHRD